MSIQIPHVLLAHGLTSPRKLYHCTKKSYIPSATIDVFCKTFPDTQKRLGALPFDLIKGISKEQIPLITQRIDEAFQEFSVNVAEIPQGWCGDYTSTEKFTPHIKKLTKQMREILNRDDISIKYASCGRQKHCHRIQVGEYSYALSSFISPKILEEGFDDYYSTSGRGFEAQNVFARYKRGSQGRFARPFMSRISAEADQSGGYILSKFIERTHAPKEKFGLWQELRKFFWDTDIHFGNSINGIVIDIGDSFGNGKYIRIPQLRADWSTFARVMDSFPNTGVNYVEQRDVLDIFTIARNNGVDICEKDFVKSLNDLSKEQVKFAKKIIKRVKTLRRLRTNMEKENRYKPVQKLLKEDFRTIYPPVQYNHFVCSNIDRNTFKEFNLHNFLIKELGIEPVREYPV